MSVLLEVLKVSLPLLSAAFARRALRHLSVCALPHEFSSCFASDDCPWSADARWWAGAACSLLVVSSLELSPHVS